MDKAYPKPADILAARKKAKLTQTQAANLVDSSLRTWQNWESGAANMHPAIFAWFQHQVQQ